MNTSLRLHPEVATLQRACEELRCRLSKLHEEQSRLEEHVRPYLEALYLDSLGSLELALLQAQADNARMRRRLELIRARTNHGTRLDERVLQAIEAQLAIEWQEWQQRLAEKERGINSAKARLSAPRLTPAENEKLKTLYRRLVRRLHPDITRTETRAYQQYWQEIQYAYQCGDVEYLDILAELLLKSGEASAADDKPVSCLDIDGEHQRLTRLLSVQVGRLAALRASPPFCHGSRLLDPAWMLAKQVELRAAIEAEAATRERLRQALDELIMDASTAVPAIH